MIYAVLDTNVIVSALMSGNPESPTKRCLRATLGERVCPLYNDKIIAEYREVLSREKFGFDLSNIEVIVDKIVADGMSIEQLPCDDEFTDQTDRVFYEVAMAKAEDGAKVVTGSVRHYPVSPIVVTPAEFCAMVGI